MKTWEKISRNKSLEKQEKIKKQEVKFPENRFILRADKFKPGYEGMT